MTILLPNAFEVLGRRGASRSREILLVAAAPAALAVLELFHPHPHALLQLDVGRWLVVHYLQVPLFALAALAVARLVRTQAGIAPRLCRVALFVFVLCFVVFDTAAGLVVGSLVQAAHASGTPAAWQAPIDAVWTHPVLGGTHRPLLALVGRVALSIGAIAAAVSLFRAGRPWMPVLLLALSGCVMYVFPSHASPGGPLTFGGLALASAWLQWSRPRAVRGQRQPRARRVVRPDRRVTTQGTAEPIEHATGARDPRAVSRDAEQVHLQGRG